MKKLNHIIFVISLLLLSYSTKSQTFTKNNNLNIPDNGAEVCSNMNVTGIGTIDGTFGLESVCIKINHTWDDDLDIFLVAPDGTRIELSTDNGAGGNHYGSGSTNNAGTKCCFDMGAGTNITAGSAPFQNSYTPEGDLGDVNNGQNANGSWSLCVTDDGPGDTGFINSWNLTFSPTPAAPSIGSSQQCIGGSTICSDQTFSGNSSGLGSSQELTGGNSGCLTLEHESSWYFFQLTTGGTVEFGIKPQNGTDDYDFAIWGPYPSTSTPASICQPSGSPIRCSFMNGAPPAYGTGLKSGAGDNSETFGSGDHIVNPIVGNAGDIYILLIDNWSASTSPFDLDWNLSGGATLNCSVLPVELTYFNGKPNGETNLLKWTTSTEINNSHFEIERAEDGINFLKIGETLGNGNSNTSKNYNFIDNTFTQKVEYYRLKQVDFDGKYEYSNVIAVKNNDDFDEVFNVSPNPFNNILNIKLLKEIDNNDEFIIELKDYLGRIIIAETINNAEGTLQLNLNNINTKGFYFITIKSSDNQIVLSEKLIKM